MIQFPYNDVFPLETGRQSGVMWKCLTDYATPPLNIYKPGSNYRVIKYEELIESLCSLVEDFFLIIVINDSRSCVSVADGNGHPQGCHQET